MLLVTERNAKSDVVQGLSAGADDFISKPVDPDELHARLRTRSAHALCAECLDAHYPDTKRG